MGRKPTRKGWIKKLDTIISDIVLKQWPQCPFPWHSVSVKSVCAFHWVSRKHHIVRWDITIPNVTASCWSCNCDFSGRWGPRTKTPNQAPFWDWYKKQFGQKQYDLLQSTYHGISDFGISDYEAKYAVLKNK